MQISLPFIPIFLFLNEPILNKDRISPPNQIEFREIVTNQKNLNLLARPIAFRKVVKNQTNADKIDKNCRNCKCAASKEPLTLEHLNKVCGLRKDDKSFDSYNYTDFDKTAKIVNGTRSKLGEWPWQALLNVPKNEALTKFSICGGVLITDDVILTAAHCIPGKKISASNLSIILGKIKKKENEEHQQIFAAKKFLRHEKFSFHSKSKIGDIGLIWMNKKAIFNCYVAPVCLPFPPGPFLNDKLNHVNAWVTGFGRLRYLGATSDDLRQVELKLLSIKKCKILYPTTLPSHICSYGKNKDACQGDSGGPVVIRYKGRWTTVAVISYGRKCAVTAGVNTRITSYESWIKDNVYLLNEDNNF